MTEVRASKRSKTGTHPQRAPKAPRNRQVGEGLTLTDEKVEKVCEALRIGAPFAAAFAYAGVKRSTMDLWLIKGRSGDPLFADMIAKVDQAVHEGLMRDLVRVDKAGDKDWQALRWKLAVRHPADFGDRSKGVTINLAQITASPDWHALRDTVLRALEAFPEALEAVVQALDGQSSIEGEAVELPELPAA